MAPNSSNFYSISSGVHVVFPLANGGAVVFRTIGKSGDHLVLLPENKKIYSPPKGFEMIHSYGRYFTLTKGDEETCHYLDLETLTLEKIEKIPDKFCPFDEGEVTDDADSKVSVCSYSNGSREEHYKGYTNVLTTPLSETVLGKNFHSVWWHKESDVVYVMNMNDSLHAYLAIKKETMSKTGKKICFETMKKGIRQEITRLKKAGEDYEDLQLELDTYAEQAKGPAKKRKVKGPAKKRKAEERPAKKARH